MDAGKHALLCAPQRAQMPPWWAQGAERWRCYPVGRNLRRAHPPLSVLRCAMEWSPSLAAQELQRCAVPSAEGLQRKCRYGSPGPSSPLSAVTWTMGSSIATEACTRTPVRPLVSGKGVTKTFDSLNCASPDFTVAATQEEATSEPVSGCTSKVRSSELPRTTAPLLAPRESAEAPAAIAHRPAPRMLLQSFTINFVLGSLESCT